MTGTGPSGPATLVIGAGGFLGGAVRRVAEGDGAVTGARVPWDDDDRAVEALVAAIRSVRTPDAPWRVVWCAGTGVVATGPEVFEAEQRLIGRVLETTSTDDAAPGTMFFASSAGAVYAGSSGVPFSEDTEPAPLAPYGRSKLEAEERFRAWAAATGSRLLIGRFSNLYGPGANLGKAQGLVSQLALAHLEGRPSSIYVPMSTTRDYLAVDDAATMVVAAIGLLEAEAPDTARTKIFASGHGATIAEVVAAVERAFGERLDVRDGTDPSATLQGRDLRFRSRVLTEVDGLAVTGFDEGVQRTVDALRASRA